MGGGRRGKSRRVLNEAAKRDAFEAWKRAKIAGEPN